IPSTTRVCPAAEADARSTSIPTIRLLAAGCGDDPVQGLPQRRDLVDADGGRQPGVVVGDDALAEVECLPAALGEGDGLGSPVIGVGGDGEVAGARRGSGCVVMRAA